MRLYREAVTESSRGSKRSERPPDEIDFAHRTPAGVPEAVCHRFAVNRRVALVPGVFDRKATFCHRFAVKRMDASPCIILFMPGKTVNANPCI